ncbi:Arf-GAP with coiled-coil, ANK repeat and PH domain-containing protein 2 [Halotydeus destructor]|nr:Arf-GAP with coiled-coil, ANK repeat and PH domain-containing protein 2 [Halotydeus destructor]
MTLTKLDLNECLIDSPSFRLFLSENEDAVEQLELKLDRLIKQTNAMVEAGKCYTRSQTAFVNAVEDIGSCLTGDTFVAKALSNIISTLSELSKYQSTLIDQTQRCVARNLSNFVKSTLSPLKETKRHFDKISEDMEHVLLKNSQVSKTKISENEESSNLLMATRSLFQHTAIDYASQLTCLQIRKKHEILDSLVSLLNAHGTFAHQGHETFQEFGGFVRETEKELKGLREESSVLEKTLERHHSLVKRSNAVPVLMRGEQGEIKLEGYLFKRTSNAFKSWHRRWFIIQDNQLVYQKRVLDKEFTVMEDDLRLCTVKPVNDIDRRFCFEIVSPTKNHILQADSVEACKQWIAAMEAGIDAAYNGHPKKRVLESQSLESIDSLRSLTSSGNSSGKSSLLESGKFASQILSVPGNEVCADCQASDPCWASINLCVTLCIECSGIHRSLGVHVSKVRSLKLDDWECTWVQIMLSLGNTIVNKTLEANVDESIVKRATASCSRQEREAWIKAKYIDKAFVDGSAIRQFVSSVSSSEEVPESAESSSDTLKDQLNLLLYKAVIDSDLVSINQWLGHGAVSNWKNAEDGMSCLHRAVQSPETNISEFLLLNGAKVNVCDNLSRTPLHLAVEAGNTRQVCLLIKRGADLTIKDVDGRDAVSIAVNNADADIVTLVRIAMLNEEMKHDEMGGASEEFNKTLGEFSAKATKKSNGDLTKNTSP